MARRGGLLGMRSVRHGGSVLATSLLVLGILVLVSMLSLFYRVRWDATTDDRFSLSPQSRKVVAALAEPVRLLAFYAGDDPRQVELKRRFAIYGGHTAKISYEFIDPDREPGLAARYGIRETGVILAVQGERREKARDESEAGITNAILRLRRSGRTRVGVLTGHGERDPLGRQRDGLVLAVDALRGGSYALNPIQLLQTPGALDSVEVLLAVGPVGELLPEEERLLDGYLDRGGRLLVLLDPPLAPRPGASFAGLLARRGIRVGSDAVVDPSPTSRLAGQDALAPLVTRYPATPITVGFRLQTFYRGVRSVSLADTLPPETSGFEILRSGQGSWAEAAPIEGVLALDPGRDLLGPVGLAAAVERAGTSSTRIVVFGDSDFVSNAQWRLPGAGDLFLNSVAWLAEKGDEIAVRGATVVDRRVDVTVQQSRVLFVIGFLLLPGLFLGAAIVVAVRRRAL